MIKQLLSWITWVFTNIRSRFKRHNMLGTGHLAGQGEASGAPEGVKQGLGLAAPIPDQVSTGNAETARGDEHAGNLMMNKVTAAGRRRQCAPNTFVSRYGNLELRATFAVVVSGLHPRCRQRDGIGNVHDARRTGSARTSWKAKTDVCGQESANTNLGKMM